MESIIINSRGEYQNETSAIAESVMWKVFFELENQGVDSELAMKIAGRCERFVKKAID
jgi:hypothetical protein